MILVLVLQKVPLKDLVIDTVPAEDTCRGKLAIEDCDPLVRAEGFNHLLAERSANKVSKKRRRKNKALTWQLPVTASDRLRKKKQYLENVHTEK